jgi:RNA polymerase sigma-70 factor (ECF subfamily)
LAQRRLNRREVEQLYDAHGGALLAYARSFTGDHAQAEDLVHQVFASLLREDRSAPDVPLAYLYRSVRNAALNSRRNGSREAPLEGAPALFVHRGGDQEAALALQAALQDLPQEQREVVIMRIWSGMTLEEIARATGQSVNTVASRYRYALAKLRERLTPRAKSLRA